MDSHKCISIVSFEKAKKIIHALKLKSIQRWKAYCEKNNIRCIHDACIIVKKPLAEFNS